ncbi:hypothetical protein HPHPH42_0040 [Helicobacter pylori Hp H-42]|uniref:Uncharacterized protein n=1 Tax=Helicobacter pylori Hp H-42 TaxID=992047 RepID=A0AB33XK16_HELPX|nr:hypothetical protein HPHPH42_0040 [Helicobacter pylori Hp H-42]
MLVSVSFGVLKRLCFSQVLINLIRIQCFFCLKNFIFKKWVFVLSFRSHFVVKIISLSLFKVFKNAFP